RYWFDGKRTERLTFDGTFNLRAQLTPDAKTLVFLSRGEDGKEHVAKQVLGEGFRSLLSTPTGVSDESPSVSPNGEWIVTANQSNAAQSKVVMVSMDGQHRVHLSARDGWIQDPTWSPYLSR
ncbi:MAG: Tol-Pal system protein TolB, partial [Pseudomonadota bacterium]